MGYPCAEDACSGQILGFVPFLCTPCTPSEAPSRVVVDAEASLFFLGEKKKKINAEEELRSRGVTLALARVHPPVLALWERAGAIDAIGKDRVFDTVRDAVHRLSDG